MMNIRTQFENDTLTLYLEGRIDSGNAASVEQEMFAALEAFHTEAACP